MNFEAALARHQQGDLAEAERLYRALIAVEPQNAEALHLLGYVALQTGRWQAAADWIGRSLQVDPTQAAARLNLGVALRNLRQLDAALTCLDGLLARAPDHAEALNNRADVLMELARPREALESLERALRVQPRFPEALNNRGRALQALGQHVLALESFDFALRLEPSFARAHNNRGTALRHLNRLEEALASFDRALQFDSQSPFALYNRGNTLLELERHEDALQCFEQLLRHNPQDAETLSNCSIALLRLGRLEESLAALRQALELQPKFPRALNNLGNTLRKLGRLEEALTSYDQALRLSPGDPDTLSNRGVALTELHRYPEALASHESALARRQDHADFYYNRGNTHLALRQMQAALLDYERALSLRNNAPDALFNRGVALLKLKRHEDAATALDRLLQVKPDYPLALGIRFHCRAQICDWSGGVSEREKIIAAVARGELVDEPFSFLAVSGSAEHQLRCARTYMADRYPSESGAPQIVKSTPGRRCRLAYVSGDFRDHPVSRLLVGVLEGHDRQRFETIGVSLNPPDGSSLGRRISAAFDKFIDASASSDSTVVALMREMQIDIAIDLMGCTEGQRTRIFARRAAPTQVNFIGYPGTMGVPYIDYLIADRFIVPPDWQCDYAESIVFLPECFQPNDDRRFLPEGSSSRDDQGLPAQAFVWCCFNNPAKMNEMMFEVWMRLLQKTPGSVLWLYADSATAERNLRREANRRGVDPGRLVFAPRVPYEQHLARLRLADVFLDTVPFNGGTTVSDALWVGLPVLTCLGGAFAARMAGSLLQVLGLPELISADLQDYESRALELAASSERRAQLREKLWRRRSESPLFNTERYCRHLEAAYTMMHERSARGDPPANLAVEPEPPESLR